MSSYKYNPVTAPLQRQYDTFSDIEMEIDEGTNLAGTNKWSGSVRAHNGKIYNIPKDATDILVIDEKTNDAYRTNMGLDLTGLNKWDGGALGTDGKIYCVPNSSSSILVIDPVSDTAELKDYGLDLSSTWSGGILAPNGKVYFIPKTSVNVVVIDTVSQTAEMTDMGTAIAEPNGPNVEALKIKYNNVYFVSPLGDDANDGSEIAPYASINMATQAASATGDAVYISAGEYIIGGSSLGLHNYGKEVSFYGVPSKTTVKLETTARDVPFISGGGKSKVFNLILIRDARGKSRNYEVAVFWHTRDFEIYNTVFKSINGRGITISYFNGGATVGKLVNCIFDLEDGVNFGGSYSGANTGLVLENCASTGNFLNGQQTLVNTTQGVDFDADYSIIDNTSSTDGDPNALYGVYAGEYKWTESAINDWFYSFTERFSGAVLGNDGKIYGIPYSAQNVLIIDPINETLSVDSLGATLSGLSKWKGGVLGKDGKIYGIPYDSSDILVIDTETQSAQRSDMGLQTDGLSKWNNGALGSDDKIYAYPEDSNKILVIDTNLNTADYLDTHIDMSGTNKYNGGISTVSSSGYMYAAPSDALDILMISTNPQSNSYQEAYRNTCFHNLGGGTSTSEDKYSDCRFNSNDKLYCLPNDNSLNFLVIDKNKNITYKNPAKFEQTETVDDGKSIIRKRYDNVYFVSINGDDDNNDGSQENPFATYYKAAETAQSGDAIFIDEGEYVLDRSFNRFSEFGGLYLYGKELDIYGVPSRTILKMVNNRTGDAGRDIPFISSNGTGKAKIFNISFIRDANFRTFNYQTKILSFIPYVEVYNCAFKSINNANVTLTQINGNVVRGKLVNCTFDIEGDVDFTASYNGVSIDLILENCVSNVSFFDENTYINTTENATLDAQFNIVSPTGINDTIGVYGGEYKWLNQYTPVLIGSDYASVLAPNGNIYCISSKPNNILIIDQEKDILSLENFGLIFESTDTWMGAVVGNDGKIYGIPYNSTRILVINPDDNTAEFKDYGLDLSGTEKWWGGVLAHDGKIYCMPYNATELLVIDPLNDTAELTDLGASLSGFALTGNKKWKGGCLGANGVIYGIPYDANNFLVIDLNLNFTSRDNLGLSLTLNGNNFNGATVSSNGKIYAVPAQERGILEIDPYKKEAKIINDNTYSTIDPKWVSTFCDDNGTVYGVPAKAENIVRIRPKKKYNMTMNPELALSPYYNKF